jgi:hypothetical protein
VSYDVANAVTFMQWLLEHKNYNECFRMMDEHLQRIVPISKLQELAEYYGALVGLWYCTATSIAINASTSIVYIPLYFYVEHHQLKLWVSQNLIVGLEFGSLHEEKWDENGQRESWTVAAPKRVLKLDGTTLEIRSPKEEEDAM